LAQSNHQFATTHWTLVKSAASEDSQWARPALNELVRRYWLPLYSFARKRGLSSEDAEDATQEFLITFVDRHVLDRADPAQGRFRAFLLTAWKRFLVDQHRKHSAQRRGGDLQKLSIDFSHGEQYWTGMLTREPDPDRIFMRSWATSMLDAVRDRLRTEYSQRNKAPLFEALVPWLTESPTASQYQQLALDFTSSPSAIKVALHRLRSRFGATLRAMVEETVDSPADVDNEISVLLESLRE
jgi:RNA polymerase sigma factor (sigma-70 family)